ncbi:Uncharacterised protein [BD1-7 clade bacterium]|uniref:Virulence protein SciE type n=1 Tax=BD1-7 clade bacterium TaxID=2029982 RepID=A0A5S9QNB2_9GAMM|nr:Uncharacterised protein [BD1-7 clade bacterium]CAA0116185.1 Uncharacterised protein [BD1-7 clade bacterium]CAA0119864.1 Uncharacterised protein [BD1-7 clade bacterium]
MQAKDHIREARLDEALSELMQGVREDPADSSKRVYLFQLFAVMGDFQRALNQLNVLGEMDAKTLMMVQTYRQLIQCEQFREHVFAGNSSPLVFGDPEPSVALMLEALKLSAAGEHEHAAALRTEAFIDIRAAAGNVSIDGAESFEWIADADSRIGPFVEAYIDGKYFWVPFTCIRSIEIHEPEDLRDLVWAPCEFTWQNGGSVVGFIPSRYPIERGSQCRNEVLLSRLTNWKQLSSEEYAGSGQRIWATNAGDYPILSCRTISFDADPTAQTEVNDAVTEAEHSEFHTVA